MKTLITFSYFLVAILAASNAIASSTTEDCLNFHVIRSEPIGYINDKGVTEGVHWEYLEAIRDHSGLCINISLFPYARIWESMKKGTHDGGIIFRSQSRSNIAKYVGHIQTTPTVVIPLNNIKLETYSDLSNLIIGNIRGAHLSKKFDNDKDLNIFELVSFEQEVKMINLKRLDAIAGNAYALIYQLDKYNVLSKVNLKSQLALGKKEQWLQMSHQSKQLDKLPILQNSLIELKKNGVFRKILLKYYGDHLSVNHSNNDVIN